MIIVSLISSGIDSPVATYLGGKKIDEIILVHGNNRPFTDERELDNFNHLAKHLKKITPSISKAYIIPHGDSLSKIIDKCAYRYTCIICKRFFLRYAEFIAILEDASAIIMGDSLGQVASQTIKNLKVVDQAVNIPVLRPLIGYDKDDVIKIAKDIGTYNLSISPSSSCSAAPKRPSTQAKLEVILDEEKKLDIENIVKNAVNNAKLIVY
jgi:thiamine biosynthesis protein ThiI